MLDNSDKLDKRDNKQSDRDNENECSKWHRVESRQGEIKAEGREW